MTNLFEKLKTSSQKNLYASSRINPHRHWVILLRVFVLCVIALIIFSFYLLYQIKNEQLFHPSEVKDATVNVVKEKLLKKVMEGLTEKEERRKEIEGR